jgi:hypothetical protein
LDGCQKALANPFIMMIASSCKNISHTPSVESNSVSVIYFDVNNVFDQISDGSGRLAFVICSARVKNYFCEYVF